MRIGKGKKIKPNVPKSLDFVHIHGSHLCHLDVTFTINGLWHGGQIILLKIRVSCSHNLFFSYICHLSFLALCWVCHLHLPVLHFSLSLAIGHQNFARFCKLMMKMHNIWTLGWLLWGWSHEVCNVNMDFELWTLESFGSCWTLLTLKFK